MEACHVTLFLYYNIDIHHHELNYCGIRETEMNEADKQMQIVYHAWENTYSSTLSDGNTADDFTRWLSKPSFGK